MADKFASQERRRRRLRYQLKVKGGGRVRLSVFRSGRHIYAQIIDDAQGRTLASASSLEKETRDALRTGADREAASVVGKRVAERDSVSPAAPFRVVNIGNARPVPLLDFIAEIEREAGAFLAETETKMTALRGKYSEAA